MSLKKAFKRSKKSTRKLLRRIFLHVRRPLFPITEGLLEIGWHRTAEIVFSVYNWGQTRFKDHWIKASEVVDLNQCEDRIEAIKLSGRIRTFSYGPSEINNANCNQAPVTLPPVYASAFKNVILHSNTSAIYAPGLNKIFLQRIQHPDEEKFHYHHKHLAVLSRRNGILRFPPTIEKVDRGILLSGTGAFNFYHYLMEFISKTEYLPKLPEAYREFPLMVHQNGLHNQNFREYLKLANQQSRPIICLDEDKSYQVECLLHISHASISPFNLQPKVKYKPGYFFTAPSAVKYLRDLVLPISQKMNKGATAYRRIFLSRKMEGRRVYNQKELVRIAEKYGFEEVFLEEYDIYAQAYLFNQAERIVGPTGAAWTNLLFASQGAQGLAWMSEKFGDFSAYSNIAYLLSFDLRYIIFSDTNRNWHAPYYLDPEKFEASLIKFLKL